MAAANEIAGSRIGVADDGICNPADFILVNGPGLRAVVYHFQRVKLEWGARPPRAQFSAPSRKPPGVKKSIAPFGAFRRVRVRREALRTASEADALPNSSWILRIFLVRGRTYSKKGGDMNESTKIPG